MQLATGFLPNTTAVSWLLSFERVASNKIDMSAESLITQFMNIMPTSFVQTVQVTQTTKLQSKQDLDNIYQLFADILAPLHNVQMEQADVDKFRMWPRTLNKASCNRKQYHTEFQQLYYESKSLMDEYDVGENFFEGQDPHMLGSS